MPPLPAIRHPALARLESVLRARAASELLQDASRIEALADDVACEQRYPLEWIAFRITDQRTALTMGDEVIEGRALLADLCALCERLCDACGMTRANAGDALTLVQLRERWHVSEPTIKRLRRAGLVTRRVLEGDIAMSVATRGVVERFEQRNPHLTRANTTPKRYDRAQRERMIRRALRYRDLLGWSVFRSAQRIAQREGVSVEGVRQLLLREPRLAESQGPEQVSPARARAMLRLSRKGADVSELSRLSGRDSATIRREVALARFEALRAIQAAQGFVCALPAKPLAAKDRHAAMTDAHVTRDLRTPWPSDLLALIHDWRDRGAVTPAVERSQLVAFCLLRAEASQKVAALDHLHPRAGVLDEIETMLRHATLLQRELVRAQHRLIIETIDARLGHATEHASPSRIIALLGDATRAAHEVTLAFDPFKSGRLAGAAGLAVDRAVTRLVRNWLPVHASASRRAMSLLGPGTPAPPGLSCMNPWLRVTEFDPRIERGVLTGRIDELHARLLVARLGLQGNAPLTRAATASLLGLDAIRFAHAEQSAIRAAIAASDPL